MGLNYQKPAKKGYKVKAGSDVDSSIAAVLAGLVKWVERLQARVVRLEGEVRDAKQGDQKEGS